MTVREKKNCNTNENFPQDCGLPLRFGIVGTQLTFYFEMKHVKIIPCAAPRQEVMKKHIPKVSGHLSSDLFRF